MYSRTTLLPSQPRLAIPAWNTPNSSGRMNSSRRAPAPSARAAHTAVASIASPNASAMEDSTGRLYRVLRAFKEAGRTLAAADAHRDDRVAPAASTQLVERRRRELRPG